MSQLIGPAVGAEKVGGVAHADRGFILLEVDAGKAAIRYLLAAGAGHAKKSGAKFREIDHR